MPCRIPCPCLLGGEIDGEQLRLALLKSLGDRWGGVLPADAP
jgi:hypothetical protein